MSQMQIRQMEPTEADLALLKALFDRNHLPKRLDELRWRYLANPGGPLLVDFAVPEGEGDLAGVYSVSSVRLKLGEEVVLGVQSIDTLTDKDHRGKGLFTKLAKATYDRSAAKDARLVYGFPNGSSAHGFFERLGWTRMDPVPFLVRPIRIPYVTKRLGFPSAVTELLPSWPLVGRGPRLRASEELRTVLEFDSSYDALWAAFSRDVGVAVHRDSRYLQWRLRELPGSRYKTVSLWDRGELQAFVTWTVADKHEGRVGYVLELIHLPDRTRPALELLKLALAEMGAAGADVALAWNLERSPNRAAFLRAGFAPFPERIRPIELHFGARHLADAGAAAVCNRDNWYLSYCDSDTV